MFALSMTLLINTGCQPPEDNFRTGSSVQYDLVVDTWSATGVDLVFFGDTSGSMGPELETMGDNALTFMSQLDEFNSNWQIIVVTGWDGCGVNGILSHEVANYDQLFAQALLTPPEPDAVAAGADEWGLHNVEEAIMASVEGGCNEDFLREDALLHIIFLSDEMDTSPGWDGGDELYWQKYVDNIIASRTSPPSAKPVDPMVTFSAVVGPDPGGCAEADPGIGYTDAVDYTGGSFLSICDDWYNQLDTLVYSSVQIVDLPLSEEAVEETLSVVVDGSERTSGWEYQASGNLVHFKKSPPTIGEEIAISYQTVVAR